MHSKIASQALTETFDREYEVIPLHFDPWLMHLDTVFGALSGGHALVYELGFEVITVPYSEVIKTGGSVRCDTLPVVP